MPTVKKDIAMLLSQQNMHSKNETRLIIKCIKIKVIFSKFSAMTFHLSFLSQLGGSSVNFIVLYLISGRNRELYFPSYYFFAGRRLRNHKIKTEHVKDLDQCEFLCYQHDDCVSVNIRKDPAIATGQRECELNNSTRIEHDRDVEDNNAYLYRGAKVIILYTVSLVVWLLSRPSHVFTDR